METTEEASQVLDGNVVGFHQVLETVEETEAPLELIHFADLRMTSPPPAFDFENDGNRAKEIADKLFEAMKRMGGVGIAANQVGLPYRLFVFGTDEVRHNIFNPRLVGVSKEVTLMQEGCLSFPGFTLTLSRPSECMLAYQTETGEEVVASFTGVSARIVQHEYDHMLGVNFTYHASPFKIQHELDKYKKRQERMMKRMGIMRGKKSKQVNQR